MLGKDDLRYLYFKNPSSLSSDPSSLNIEYLSVLFHKRFKESLSQFAKKTSASREVRLKANESTGQVAAQV